MNKWMIWGVKPPLFLVQHPYVAKMVPFFEFRGFLDDILRVQVNWEKSQAFWRYPLRPVEMLGDAKRIPPKFSIFGRFNLTQAAKDASNFSEIRSCMLQQFPK